MAKEKPAAVAFISSPRFVEHETGHFHPERPDRIRAIHRAVRAAGLIDSPDPFPDFELDLGTMPRAPFKVVEIAPAPAEEQWVELVHPPEHVRQVRRVAEAGGGVLDQGD